MDHQPSHVTRAGNWRTLQATVVAGYGVASGRAPDCPYEGGSLRHQFPLFQSRGVDLTRCYLGTINLTVAPWTIHLRNPPYRFERLEWHPAHPAETFSLAHCQLTHGGRTVSGFVYYPHPETKTQHFQDASTVEVICEYLTGITPGVRLTLSVDETEVSIRRV